MCRQAWLGKRKQWFGEFQAVAGFREVDLRLARRRSPSKALKKPGKQHHCHRRTKRDSNTPAPSCAEGNEAQLGLRQHHFRPIILQVPLWLELEWFVPHLGVTTQPIPAQHNMTAFGDVVACHCSVGYRDMRNIEC